MSQTDKKVKAKEAKEAKETKKEEPKKTDDLKLAIEGIHKDEGNESLRVGLTSGVMKCEVISTRCLSLDAALGVGGIPRGRVTEIFGPESSGKTTLALTVIAEAQARGGVAVFVDAEHALDPDYARNLGVNLDALLFSQPDSGEQAMRIVEKLIRSNRVDIVVVDSVAALVPQKELEGEVGDHHIALQAQLMSQSLRKFSGILCKTKTSLIFINQIREKMMVMPGTSPETTPGGRALKFYSSVRLDIRKVETLKIGEKAHGSGTKVKVVKNKVAPPFRIAEFQIIWGKGINTIGSLIEIGVEHNLIEKNGSWYGYQGNRIGQSFQAACDWLKGQPEMVKELDSKLRELVLPKPTIEDVPDVPDLKAVQGQEVEEPKPNG